MRNVFRDSLLHTQVVVCAVAVIRDHEVVVRVTLAAPRLAGAATTLVCLTIAPVEKGLISGTHSPFTSVARIVNTTVNWGCYFPQNWVRTIKRTFFTFWSAGEAGFETGARSDVKKRVIRTGKWICVMIYRIKAHVIVFAVNGVRS